MASKASRFSPSSRDHAAVAHLRGGPRPLSLFGSALRDDFRPDSDLDLLVEFEPDASYSLFDLVALQDELKDLLGREVDLVEASALRNPFRRREILRTRRLLYAA